MSSTFDFGIEWVVDLLGLERKGQTRGTSFDVVCPFCGHSSASRKKKYTMNINVEKDVYHCYKCGTGERNTGVLDLYSRVKYGEPAIPGQSQKIYRELMDIYTNGAYSQTFSERRERKPYEDRNIYPAADDILAIVYDALLSFPPFALNEEDLENLKKRGLTESDIKQNGYRSVPSDYRWVYDQEWQDYVNAHRKLLSKAHRALSPRFEKCIEERLLANYIAGQWVSKQLERKRISPKAVPGFYRIKNQWAVNIFPGMIIPTRNEKGQIVCMQIRLRRVQEGDLRYLTVSSGGLPEGPTANISRAHFPLDNCKIKKGTLVYITEGPLKADVIVSILKQKKELNGKAFVAIHGISNLNDLEKCFDRFAERGVGQIVDAYDMDKFTNIHVAKGSAVMHRKAEERGFNVLVLYWDIEHAEKQLAQLRHQATFNDEVSVSEVRRKNYNKCVLANLLLYSAAFTKAGADCKHWGNEKTKGYDDYLKSSGA